MTQERDQKRNLEQGQGKRPNIEGEGAKEFAQSGKAREQGEKARRDMDSPDHDELRRTEKEGKRHARDDDPTSRKP